MHIKFFKAPGAGHLTLGKSYTFLRVEFLARIKQLLPNEMGLLDVEWGKA